MNRERAEELQARLAKEAVSLLSCLGTADTALHERAITLTGQAWAVPQDATESQLNLIRREKEVVKSGKSARELPDILPESDLRQWTGMETLDVLEDLFETAVRLEAYEDRKALLDMAKNLMEYENFLDWVELTPQERAEFNT